MWLEIFMMLNFFAWQKKKGRRTALRGLLKPSDGLWDNLGFVMSDYKLSDQRFAANPASEDGADCSEALPAFRALKNSTPA